MLILTPNRRLAAFSLKQHQQVCLAQGLKVWDTPQIMPLESWLQEIWLRSNAYKPVLTKNQQQLIIERIIQNSDSGTALLRIPATAKNVIDAWGFIRKWRIPLTVLKEYAQYSVDTAAFCQWIEQYNNWVLQEGRIDQQSLGEALMQEIPNMLQFLPDQICLRGMQDIPPQHAAIFQTLVAHGVKVVHDDLLAGNNPSANRIAYADQQQELQAAALWAAQQHGLQVGVVVPDLELRREQIANVFLEHIPDTELNIAAPQGLSTFPLIDTALLILQQAKPNLDYEDLSILLRSPYIKSGKYDQNRRARLDRKFRDLGISIVPTRKKRNTDLQRSNYWAELITQLLQAWGWPGLQDLTKVEADLLQCWQDLLHEYCNLDFILGAHSFADALQYIQRLAAATEFAPAETGNTRVHILGTLEAEGICFDKLWIMGMTRESWPMEIKPNPFIPMEIQRHYNLPRSSPQRELEVALRLTANLQRGAQQEVLFSYALLVNETECAVSNLLLHLPELTLTLPNAALTAAELESFVDDQAPALTEHKVKGGTKVLKLQAQCPFKANAELRLRAEPLSVSEPYLNPMQRGALVHEILEWYYLEDGKQAISSIIDLVLRDWQRRYPVIFSDNYLNLERDRLLILLQEWVAYEQKRKSSQDFQVESLEQRHAVQIGPLTINIQVDRVDRLADGTQIVIDYKTGTIQAPDPQMAIYAHYIAPNAQVYYVQAGKIKLQPYNPNEEIDIQELATDFCRGQASVKPAAGYICQTCNLQAFCRIYAQSRSELEVAEQNL